MQDRRRAGVQVGMGRVAIQGSVRNLAQRPGQGRRRQDGPRGTNRNRTNRDRALCTIGANHNVSRNVSHSALIEAILGLCINRPDLVIWKNQTGYDPLRQVRYGLVGSADLLCCRAVRITPEMVGRRMGLFIAIEAKTGRGTPSDAQLAFGAAIARCGGIYRVARTVDEAGEVLG